MTTATERGDLAESLVPVASELAFLVRDQDRTAIGEWMDCHGIPDGPVRALLVVLAARGPVDVTDDQALAWLTFDEFGRPLEQTAPLLPVLPVSGDGEEHGTFLRYLQHRKDGDQKQTVEACGCQQAARDYWNAQKARPKTLMGQIRSDERKRSAETRKAAERRAPGGDGQRRGEAAA